MKGKGKKIVIFMLLAPMLAFGQTPISNQVGGGKFWPEDSEFSQIKYEDGYIDLSKEANVEQIIEAGWSKVIFAECVHYQEVDGQLYDAQCPWTVVAYQKEGQQIVAKDGHLLETPLIFHTPEFSLGAWWDDAPEWQKTALKAEPGHKSAVLTLGYLHELHARETHLETWAILRSFPEKNQGHPMVYRVYQVE